MDIRTVGVVGCGQMGGGIAQVAAAVGYSVVVMDASPEPLEKGLGRIRAQLCGLHGRKSGQGFYDYPDVVKSRA